MALPGSKPAFLSTIPRRFLSKFGDDPDMAKIAVDVVVPPRINWGKDILTKPTRKYYGKRKYS
jgi:hypothetical protein